MPNVNDALQPGRKIGKYHFFFFCYNIDLWSLIDLETFLFQLLPDMLCMEVPQWWCLALEMDRSMDLCLILYVQFCSLLISSLLNYVRYVQYVSFM